MAYFFYELGIAQNAAFSYNLRARCDACTRKEKAVRNYVNLNAVSL